MNVRSLFLVDLESHFREHKISQRSDFPITEGGNKARKHFKRRFVLFLMVKYSINYRHHRLERNEMTLVNLEEIATSCSGLISAFRFSRCKDKATSLLSFFYLFLFYFYLSLFYFLLVSIRFFYILFVHTANNYWVSPQETGVPIGRNWSFIGQNWSFHWMKLEIPPQDTGDSKARYRKYTTDCIKFASLELLASKYSSLILHVFSTNFSFIMGWLLGY